MNKRKDPDMKTQFRKLISLLWLGMAILLMTSCGGGNSGSSPKTLKETLKRLGVDTSVTQRTDENNKVIDDSYAPMGRTISLTNVDNGDGTSSPVMGSLQEMFLMGFRTPSCVSGNCYATLVDDVKSTTDFTNNPTVLYQSATATPWAQENLKARAIPETLRAATGADIDGDGRSEVVIAYLDQANNEVHVSIADTDAPGAPVTDMIVPLSADQFPVTNISITSGNFDADTEDEIAIGISHHSASPFTDSGATVVILDGRSSDYAVLNRIAIPALDNSRAITLVMKPVQIDYDGPMELVTVQNEQHPDRYVNIFDLVKGYQNLKDREAFYNIFDNVATNPTSIRSGHIEANVEYPIGGDKHVMRAMVADVSVGDTDHDSLDEIYFAGLVDPQPTCEGVGHILVSMDDAAHAFRTLSESYSDVVATGNCPAFDPWELGFAHINLLDIYGDGNLEIQLNQFIFDTPPQGNTDWYAAKKYTPIYNFNPPTPVNNLIFRNDEARALFDQSNSVMTVGDVTGDGKDNLITYLEGNNEIIIYGYDAGTDRFTEVASTLTVGGSRFDRINPVIVPMNTDSDTIVYALKKHEFTIMNPIPLGVLAAPPCELGIGQKLDNCTTTWGQSTTLGVNREKGYQISASATVGMHLEHQSCAVVAVGAGVAECITDLELEIKGTVDAALGKSHAKGYELTKSIAFTTGPLEDSIVYTVLPVDTYYYTPLLYAKGEGNVDLVVTLPRDPVLGIAQLSYYNNSVHNAKDRIPADTFQHIPGDLSSYPSKVDKDYILSQKRSQLETVRMDTFNIFDPYYQNGAPLDALEGLAVGPVTVGQGNGYTQLGMDLATSSDLTVTNEVGFTLEGEILSGPAIVGFSIGWHGHQLLTVSKGSSTSYYGNIGSIDAAHYANNQYQFGLFTYLEANPETGEEFEVINYWVQ